MSVPRSCVIATSNGYLIRPAKEPHRGKRKGISDPKLKRLRTEGPINKRLRNCAKPPQQIVRQITVGCTKSRIFYPGDVPILACSDAGRKTFKSIKQLAKNWRPRRQRRQPPPEENLGGGDICSLQEQASTDDDQPLD